MELRLVSEKYSDDILDYVQEFKLEQGVNEKPIICGSSSIGHYTLENWFEKVENEKDPKKLLPGYVVATQYLAYENNRLVGMIQLRHELNDYLFNFGGNIGYSIRQSERRKGYGKKMLQLVLDKARELALDKVLITCKKDNEASRKTILSCGGIFENEVYDTSDNALMQRYWIEL